MRQIAIYNQSTVVTDAAVQAAVAAIQRQITEHFAPLWGISAQLTYMPGNPDKNKEFLVILDTSDQADALGYHELEGTVPAGFVFAKSTIDDGEHWTTTLSHEVLEQLADPNVELCAIGALKGRKMVAVAYETCDAVEGDEYTIDGVIVSNFVTPKWFLGLPGSGQDYLGKLRKGLTLTKGGYVAYTSDLRNWQDVYGAEPTRHAEQAPLRPGSRRHRRGQARKRGKIEPAVILPTVETAPIQGP